MSIKWRSADPRSKSDEELLELTGLSRGEFEDLVVLLGQRWEEVRKARVEAARMGPRVRASGAGRPSVPFRSRFFLVLVALRSGSTFRNLQAQYGVGKDVICRSVGRLCELIPSLGITRRNGSVIWDEGGLAELLGEMAQQSDEDDPGSFRGAALIDGSFTQVGRPAGWAEQKVLYSFYRHRHCLVFQTLVDHTGDLLWLSGHFPGSTHDLTALHQSTLAQMLKTSRAPLVADKGYQGVRERLDLDADHLVYVPIKKPRNGELDKTDKVINRAFAQVRIKVEHAHSTLKNWQVLRRYRGRHTQFTNVLRTIGVLATFKHRSI